MVGRRKERERKREREQEGLSSNYHSQNYRLDIDMTNNSNRSVGTRGVGQESVGESMCM